jgi:hypothetical protein
MRPDEEEEEEEKFINKMRWISLSRVKIEECK